MRVEVYVPRASAVHALHPATKIVLLAALIVGPFLAGSPWLQAVALASALGAAALGRVLRESLGPWRLLAFIFTITFVLWGFLGDGRHDVALEARMVAALAYAIRVTAVFLVGIVFLATTRVEATVHGLGTLGVPFRVAFALGLAFRLVPLFLASAGAIQEAQRARGLDLEAGGALGKLRRFVPVLVPVFMTSLKGADAMALALDARGFSRPERRTRYTAYAFGAPDVVAMLLGALYVALFVGSARGFFSIVPTAG